MSRLAKKQFVVRMVVASCGFDAPHFFIIAPSR